MSIPAITFAVSTFPQTNTHFPLHSTFSKLPMQQTLASSIVENSIFYKLPVSRVVLLTLVEFSFVLDCRLRIVTSTRFICRAGRQDLSSTFSYDTNETTHSLPGPEAILNPNPIHYRAQICGHITYIEINVKSLYATLGTRWGQNYY